MDPDEGRIVVVTGAAGGTGDALVRALHDRGAGCVVATDIDLPGVERLGEELGAARVLARALDVTDEQATARSSRRSTAA
jgi:NADP-dependent 3-hydroxy acid dehydrogenase YdfG